MIPLFGAKALGAIVAPELAVAAVGVVLLYNTFRLVAEQRTVRRHVEIPEPNRRQETSESSSESDPQLSSDSDQSSTSEDEEVLSPSSNYQTQNIYTTSCQSSFPSQFDASSSTCQCNSYTPEHTYGQLMHGLYSGNEPQFRSDRDNSDAPGRFNHATNFYKLIGGKEICFSTKVIQIRSNEVQRVSSREDILQSRTCPDGNQSDTSEDEFPLPLSSTYQPHYTPQAPNLSGFDRGSHATSDTHSLLLSDNHLGHSYQSSSQNNSADATSEHTQLDRSSSENTTKLPTWFWILMALFSLCIIRCLLCIILSVIWCIFNASNYWIYYLALYWIYNILFYIPFYVIYCTLHYFLYCLYYYAIKPLACGLIACIIFKYVDDKFHLITLTNE